MTFFLPGYKGESLCLDKEIEGGRERDCVCVNKHVWMLVHKCICGDQSPDVIPEELSTLGLTSLTRLADQCIPGILLSPLLSCWDHKLLLKCTTFLWVLGIKPKPLCFCSRNFICQATLPAPRNGSKIIEFPNVPFAFLIWCSLIPSSGHGQSCGHPPYHWSLFLLYCF